MNIKFGSLGSKPPPPPILPCPLACPRDRGGARPAGPAPRASGGPAAFPERFPRITGVTPPAAGQAPRSAGILPDGGLSHLGYFDDIVELLKPDCGPGGLPAGM